MFSGRIDSCYDSHVHWSATGEFAERLRLESLGSAAEILNIAIADLPARDGWILGFGWNQNQWSDKDRIHRRLLDEWCPDQPVLLTRIDGHVGWANTLALKKAGWINEQGDLLVDVPVGGRIELDAEGRPTGILVDKAYDDFRSHVPRVSPADLRRHLLKAAQMFHAEGVTHIRDVGATRAQWQQAMLLDRAQLTNLAVEMFFHLDSLNDLDPLCLFAASAKHESGRNLSARGIKVFLDGALGSEGAWISQPYRSGSGSGLTLLSRAEIETVFRTVWENGLEVAIHVIGDAAAHEAVSAAVSLKQQNIKGRLHLEHAEIVRPETIALMNGLDIICHMQPCHWLSDSAWLKDKVGDTLTGWSFPWRRLQEAAVPFDFGSDTPIEPPNVRRTLQALEESAVAGIPKLLGRPERFLTHPDRSWAPNSYTVFEDGRPMQVVFRGDHLI